jgi:hypothetical protein
LAAGASFSVAVRGILLLGLEMETRIKRRWEIPQEGGNAREFPELGGCGKILRTRAISGNRAILKKI